MTRFTPQARLTRRGFLGAALAACVQGPFLWQRPSLSLRSPEIGRMARWAG